MKPHDRRQFSLKYRFSVFEVDPQDTSPLRLLKDNQRCKIQDKQFALLVCLVTRHRQEVSYEDLIRAGWGYEPCPEDSIVTKSRVVSLHTQIHRLGKVIGKAVIENHKRARTYQFKEHVTEETSRKEPAGAFEDLTFRFLMTTRETRGIELFFGFFVIASLLYLVGFLVYASLTRFDTMRWDPRVILSMVQFVVVGGALIASFFIFEKSERDFPQSDAMNDAMREACGYADSDRWNEAKRSAKDSLRTFLSHWKLLLGAWTFLYLAMVGKYWTPADDVDKCLLCGLFTIASGALNNFNSIAIALCFVVLDQPTIFGKDGSTTNLKQATRRLNRSGLIAIGAIAAIQAAVLFWHFAGGLGSVLLSKVFGGADVLSGLAGGVTLALFVGRVQSKFLGPSTWLPITLYFYVSLQSLYMAIAQTPTRGALIIECALILKCLLFLYVTWLFKSGRFLFYFLRVKTVYEHANPDWKTFFLNLDRKPKRRLISRRLSSNDVGNEKTN